MPDEDELPDAPHPFWRLLGGVRGALESVLPPLVFVAVYFALGADSSALTWAIVAAVALALAFTVWRLIERKHPARALGSLLFVLLSAYVASKTGSAVNFFWPRVLVNFISAVAFVVANLIGWPLIGVVIGPIVGTRMRWRKDPVLLRAYQRASWPWAALNLFRALFLMLFINDENLWVLAVSGALFYGLTFLVIIVSWRIIRRAIPDDHPGLRSPVIDAS